MYAMDVAVLPVGYLFVCGDCFATLRPHDQCPACGINALDRPCSSRND